MDFFFQKSGKNKEKLSTICHFNDSCQEKSVNSQDWFIYPPFTKFFWIFSIAYSKFFSKHQGFGLVVKTLDSQSRGPLSQPLGDSKVDSAFHSSKVNKISTKKVNCLLKVALALGQLNPMHKKGP